MNTQHLFSSQIKILMIDPVPATLLLRDKELMHRSLHVLGEQEEEDPALILVDYQPDIPFLECSREHTDDEITLLSSLRLQQTLSHPDSPCFVWGLGRPENSYPAYDQEHAQERLSRARSTISACGFDGLVMNQYLSEEQNVSPPEVYAVFTQAYQWAKAFMAPLPILPALNAHQHALLSEDHIAAWGQACNDNAVPEALLWGENNPKIVDLLANGTT